MPQYYHHKNEAVEREGVCRLEKIQIPSQSFNTSTLVVSQCLGSFTCMILVSIALCMGFFLWLRISDLFKMLHLRLRLKLAMTESETV